MTKEIVLTQGKVALVDDCDFERVNQYKWHIFKVSGALYAARGFVEDEKKKLVLMHRFILDAESGMIVDHANHDGLDNRRENIRLCSHAENTRNRRPSMTVGGRPVASVYKGVVRGRNYGMKKWQARIRHNGKRYTLGAYKTEQEAAEAYDAAARYFHGEFASTNFEGSLALSVEEIRKRARRIRKTRR